MVPDPAFIDTNVLIYASQPASHYYEAARAGLAAFDAAASPMWVSNQVLREYFAAVTRPQNGAPALPTAEALRDLHAFMERFDVAQDTPLVLTRLLALLATIPTGGRQVHDANLVATMLENGITLLLTFNVRDFRRFAGLVELVPI